MREKFKRLRSKPLYDKNHIGLLKGKKAEIRLVDGDKITIRNRGKTKCFTVHLHKVMSYQEIRERMKRGFGDSD